jgi:hypothetical protein
MYLRDTAWPSVLIVQCQFLVAIMDPLYQSNVGNAKHIQAW